MSYKSVFANISEQHLFNLLISAIPDKELGWSEVTAFVNDQDFYNVAGHIAYSKPNAMAGLRNIITDHIIATTNTRHGLQGQIEIAGKINSLFSALCEVALHEQQKDISLEFFDALDGSKKSSKIKPKLLNQYNFKLLQKSLNEINKAFIISPTTTEAIEISTKNFVHHTNTPENISEMMTRISVNSYDSDINLISVDANLLFSLLNSPDGEYWLHAAKRIDTWFMQAVSALKERTDTESIEVFGVKTSIIGAVVATASLLFSKLPKSYTVADKESLRMLIKSQLNEQKIFPFYSKSSLEKITAWIDS